MPCYHPLDAWRGAVAPSSGKARLIFKRPDGKFTPDLQVPCGKCIGCKLEYSRQWAVRCMHEASLHEQNCFVTITYDDTHLPYGGTLVKEDLQKFQKRLNKWCTSYIGQAPRFFQCGEYGETLGRPHYHLCLFGFDFYDKVRLKENERGEILYTSELLTKLWGRGEHDQQLIGDLTFESAAYVARYVTKKITGSMAEDHYTRILDSGEMIQLEPEFVTMSRGGRGHRGGIGREWFSRFSSDVFPSDEVVCRGFAAKPPRYYDELLAKSDVLAHAAMRQERIAKASRREADGTPERLRVREAVRLSRIKSLQRKL